MGVPVSWLLEVSQVFKDHEDRKSVQTMSLTLVFLGRSMATSVALNTPGFWTWTRGSCRGDEEWCRAGHR